MRLWHTLRRLHRHLKQSRRVSAPRLPAFRPQLEALEERQLLSTMSAINCNSGGVEHQVVYTIGKNNDVLLSVDGRSPVSLGGYAKQISAGLDATGHPEVFAIGSDNAVYENRGTGWVGLGGYVKQISATVNNTVYAIGSNDAVYENQGSGYVRLGGYVKQISAGLDATGHPEVYGIARDNTLWVNRGTGWVGLGGYVKQISATVNNTVYAIGSDDAVYENRGSGYVRLGSLYDPAGSHAAQEISAGLDAHGHPEVYEMGSDNGVYLNQGGAWLSLNDAYFALKGGSYAWQISAPAFGGGTPGNVVYAVGASHQCLEHTVSSWNSLGSWNNLGGYVRIPTDPGMISSALVTSASGVTYTASAAIDVNNDLVFSGTNGTYVVPFQAKAVSLGSWAGSPLGGEGTDYPVFIIGMDNQVYTTWPYEFAFHPLGIQAKQISATVDDTVYAITSNNAVIEWQNGDSANGGLVVSLGGYAKQISAGVDAQGHAEVFAIGLNDDVWVNDGGGWVGLGGYAKQISAGVNNTVFAIGSDNAVYENRGTGWVDLGGYAQQISASRPLPFTTSPMVFAIGIDNAVYANQGNGWSDVGGYALEISAPPINWSYWSFNWPEVFAVGLDHGEYVHTIFGWQSLGGQLL